MATREPRSLEKALLRERSREITRMAIDDPRLAQCWGARFAPPHIDETLFFYTNMIVQQWTYAWEDHLLTEEQARDYLRQFFDSEVPRMFWERHGDWHQPRRTLTRADQFIALMDSEYLCALKAGPPSRSYEVSAGPLGDLGSGSRVERAFPDLPDEVTPSFEAETGRGLGSLRVADAA